MLLSAASVQAKLFSVGAKGGITLSSLSLKDNFKSNFSSDNRTGFFIGPMVQLNLPLGFAVDGAVMYAQDNIKFESQFSDVKDKRRMIEIPINLKWSINFAKVIGIYATAGPDFSFNLKNVNKVRDYVAENLSAAGVDPARLENNSKQTTIGISVGAGVILLTHLQVGFNYVVPLQDDYKFSVDGIGDILTSKNKRWQISAAYIF